MSPGKVIIGGGEGSNVGSSVVGAFVGLLRVGLRVIQEGGIGKNGVGFGVGFFVDALSLRTFRDGG